MNKPENHPPALSTDPGCDKCYRGRVLTDVVTGERVELDKRTYGATWLKCECTKPPLGERAIAWIMAHGQHDESGGKCYGLIDPRMHGDPPDKVYREHECRCGLKALVAEIKARGTR